LSWRRPIDPYSDALVLQHDNIVDTKPCTVDQKCVSPISKLQFIYPIPLGYLRYQRCLSSWRQTLESHDPIPSSCNTKTSSMISYSKVSLSMTYFTWGRLFIWLIFIGICLIFPVYLSYLPDISCLSSWYFYISHYISHFVFF
jgi:hypothetical protein